MKLRDIYINVAIVALSSLVAFGLSECVLRTYESRLMAYGTLPAPAEQMEIGLAPGEDFAAFQWHDDGNGTLYRKSADSTLIYELNPNVTLNAFIRTNAQGFRDRDFTPEKRAGVFRIMVVGDSITFGWWERPENLFPRILETLLNQDKGLGREFEVYNLGVGGYNTEQEAELIRVKALDYSPDLIVIQYCTNDNAFGVDGGLWRHFTRSQCRTWDFIRLTAFRIRESLARENVVERSFGRIQRWSTGHGIPAMAILFPSDPFVPDPLTRTQEFLERLRFPCVALTKLFAPFGSQAIMHDVFHPNGLGHRIAAEALYEYLKQNIGRPCSEWTNAASDTFHAVHRAFVDGLERQNRGEIDGAVKSYHEAASIVPEYSPFAGACLAKAAARFRRESNANTAAEAARAACAFDSSSLVIYKTLCLCLQDTGDAAGAIQAFVRARELGREDDALRSTLTGSVLRKVASLISENKAGEALPLYRSAQELNRLNEPSVHFHGELLSKAGHDDGGVRRDLIAWGPKQARDLEHSGKTQEATDLRKNLSYLNVGEHAEKTREGAEAQREGRLDDAATAYEDAMTLAPADYEAFDRLDALRMQQGGVEACKRQWAEAAQRYPLAARASYLLGKALAAEHDLEGAAAAYRTAAALNPNDAAIPSELARTLLDMRDWVGAADAMRAALELNPDASHLRPLLVEALLESKRIEEARDEAAACAARGIGLPDSLAQRLSTLTTPPQ